MDRRSFHSSLVISIHAILRPMSGTLIGHMPTHRRPRSVSPCGEHRDARQMESFAAGGERRTGTRSRSVGGGAPPSPLAVVPLGCTRYSHRFQSPSRCGGQPPLRQVNSELVSPEGRAGQRELGLPPTFQTLHEFTLPRWRGGSLPPRAWAGYPQCHCDGVGMLRRLSRQLSGALLASHAGELAWRARPQARLDAEVLLVGGRL